MDVLGALLKKIMPNPALKQWFIDGGLESLIPSITKQIEGLTHLKPTTETKKYPTTRSTHPIVVLRMFCEQVSFLTTYPNPARATMLLKWLKQGGLLNYKANLLELVTDNLLSTDVFNKQYTILKCLGQGDDGVVFQLQDAKGDRSALKFVPTDWQGQDEYLVAKALTAHRVNNVAHLYATIQQSVIDVELLGETFPNCQKKWGAWRTTQLLGLVIDEVPISITNSMYGMHVFELYHTIYTALTLGISPRDVGEHNMGYYESKEPLTYTVDDYTITFPPGRHLKLYDYGHWDIVEPVEPDANEMRERLIHRAPLKYTRGDGYDVWMYLLGTKTGTPNTNMKAIIDMYFVQFKAEVPAVKP